LHPTLKVYFFELSSIFPLIDERVRLKF